MSFEQSVSLVLVDKGLLALLLALAAWLFARSLERLKFSLSFGAEVLKQRLDVAKRALTALTQLEHAHLNAIGNRTIANVPTSGNLNALMDATSKFELFAVELSLLQASSETIALLERVVHVAASDFASAPPEGAAKTTLVESPRGMHIGQPSPDVEKWMKERTGALSTAAKAFRSSLGKNFQVSG